jgi:hypothetical protein
VEIILLRTRYAHKRRETAKNAIPGRLVLPESKAPQTGLPPNLVRKPAEKLAFRKTGAGIPTLLPTIISAFADDRLREHHAGR